MKIAFILIISFVIVAVLGSIGGSYYFYLESGDLLEHQVINHLDSVAQGMENSINGFLEEQIDKLNIVATHGELSVEELIEIRDLQDEFYEVFVLDSKGIIIASSDVSKIGLDRAEDDYFIGGIKGDHIKTAYFSDITFIESIAVSTPYNGGVLVARIELEAFNKLISDRTGLGETGESLLGYKGDDGEAVFFTELKFEVGPDGHEAEHVTLPIEEALDGKEEIFFEYDYRHVPVIAATRYIEDVDMGLVTKIDEAEALGIARNRLFRTSLIVIIIITLIITLVGFFVSRLISKPIKKLTQDVDEITKGKLDLQLGKSNLFEIQGLVNSLNRILASLKLAILKTGSAKGSLGLGEVVKAKQEAEEKYKILYETSQDAIMILEPPKWNFTAGNPATVKMFGAKDEKDFISYGPGKLSPKNQLNGKLSSEEAKKMIGIAMKKGSYSFYWTHKKINGKSFYASVLLTKMKLNGKDVLQATVRDLSGKKGEGEKQVLAKKSEGKVVNKLVKSVKKDMVSGNKKNKEEVKKKNIKKELVPPSPVSKSVIKKNVDKEEVKK
ncbi:cache and HAMP domain-containing protein [archaeon]|jgi:PAS domain-containing protein|nr:cache and HAMP domain-containing protein [archaeon]MBT4242005.1 cache and HAMP domain-containing protein [archaeon]MBT4418552.1 cache and HAMP domain-containing protein [archaeon]